MSIRLFLSNPGAALAVGLLCAACSSLEPADAGITVRNDTGVSLVVLALTAELAARTDPAMELDVADHGDRLVHHGDELTIAEGAIMGEPTPGDGLVLFLYRVSEDLATFATTKIVAGTAIESGGGRVTIEAGDLGGGE